MKAIEVIFEGSVLRTLNASKGCYLRVTPYSDGGFEVRECNLGKYPELVAVFSRDYSFIAVNGDQSN